MTFLQMLKDGTMPHGQCNGRMKPSLDPQCHPKKSEILDVFSNTLASGINNWYKTTDTPQKVGVSRYGRFDSIRFYS